LPERSILPHVAGRCRGPRLASRIEIPARKQVAHRYDSRTHGPVFVGPLGPRYVVRYPQVKAHRDYFNGTPENSFALGSGLLAVG
jgi:hypothetical protein